MPKKIDYASMFTLRADGRYQGYWHELVDGKPSGPRHTIYDRDPEKLYFCIQDEEIRRRPELKTLFSLSSKATVEDVNTTIKIIQALRGGQSDE